MPTGPDGSAYPSPPLGLDGNRSLGGQAVPEVVAVLAGSSAPELVWRNELGGLTFRIGERFVKWNPRSTGVDLDRERVRMTWLSARHPAPAVVDHGADDTAQWLVTEAVPGGHAVGDPWRDRPEEAIGAIAAGLRVIHGLPAQGLPPRWSEEAWFNRTVPDLGPRPPVEAPVVVHGDACAPNTLISPSGAWTGHVDVGDLGVGDRWADLAIASLSLDWNFGEGHQPFFFQAYGIDPDPIRIAYYRELWHRES